MISDRCGSSFLNDAAWCGILVLKADILALQTAPI